MSYPSAINDAITTHLAHLKSKDPRFDIKVTATETGTTLFISAQEPVDVQLTFKSDPERRDELESKIFDKGMVTELAAGEFTLAGSPLFESEIFKDILKLQVARTIVTDIFLTIVDANGAVEAELAFRNTQVVGGTKEARFEASIFDGLVSFRGTAVTGDGGIRISLVIDLEKWLGRPITGLPHFKTIAAYIRASLAGKIAQIQVGQFDERRSLGNAPSFTDKTRRSWERMEQVIKLIELASVIQQRLSVNLALPQRLSMKDFDMTETVFLATDYGTVRPDPDLRSTTQFGELPAKAFESLKSGTLPLTGTIRTVKETTAVKVLGTVVTVPSHVYILTDMIGDVRQPITPDSIWVEWRGTPETTITVQPYHASGLAPES